MALTPPPDPAGAFNFTPPPAARKRQRARRLRFMLGAIAWTVLAVGGLIFGFATALAQELASIDLKNLNRSGQLEQRANGAIYAGKDCRTKIATLRSDENRVLIKLSAIRPVMQEAIVAIEDRRFFQHGAIDPIGLARATAVNAWSGKLAQGGSTLTQQVAKNLWRPEGALNRTFRRKLFESAIAYEMEQNWSKKKILETYLNTVYFGNQAYGVEAASEIYFERSASKLTVAQAALLAGMVQNPTAYDPERFPRRAKERRDVVLGKLLEQGSIDQFQYLQAKGSPLTPPGHEVGVQTARRENAEAFVDYVRQQLRAKYGVDRFGRDRSLGLGLKVCTTLDLSMQRQALQAVRHRLGGTRLDGTLVSIEPGSGAVRAMVGGRWYRSDDVFIRSRRKCTTFKHKRKFVKRCIDVFPGYPTQNPHFNLATLSHRQPGSSFKTFVLLAALQQGILPQSTFNSSRQLIQLDGATWSVETDNGQYLGPITLARATTVSDNTVYAQLIMRIGPKPVADISHLMGIRRPIDPVPAIALGGIRQGVSALEMAHAYATLASKGVRVGGSVLFGTPAPGSQGDASIDPRSITKITDSKGKILFNRPVATRVIDDNIARTAIDVLRTVPRSGTAATSLSGFPWPTAGKTGTTENFTDAWYIGMTPNLVTAVWVGDKNINRLVSMAHSYRGRPVFGGTYPAQIWGDFMERALQSQPKRNWNHARPIAGQSVLIDRVTNKLSYVGCRQARSLVLAYWAIPKDAAPCPATPSLVPNLMGATRVQAERASLRIGALKLQVVPIEPVQEVTPGTIFFQDPAPYQYARLGSTIRVGIAPAHQRWIVVPNVIGKREQAARSLLAVKSDYSVTVERVVDDRAAGTVIEQAPDETRPRYAPVQVTLFVSSGPEG